jgi:hypothetical protein
MQVNSVAKQFYFTTVRIDTVGIDGLPRCGTGFICNHSVKGINYRFIVSNKHVVFEQKSGRLTMVRGKNGQPDLGQGISMDLIDWPDVWYGHPDPNIDVAVCPLLPIVNEFTRMGVDPHFHEIDTNLIPSQADIEDVDAIEPVTFIGYPNGIWDSVNFLPIIRRGTLASPLEVDFEGKRRFLIDASVFPGSSGSPVFIYNSSGYSRRGTFNLGSRVLFVGIIAEVYFRAEHNQLIPLPVPTAIQLGTHTREMIDLGIVVKADTIVETIVSCLDSRGKW